ncbi:D-alanyl-D-alanine carboxypeptidase dacF [[Clostridium] ultunense Esp]|uniref:serine-type D-Ala-D-Ala carboxypeptidase n=1 Tax=[Clostridium] ultunense Esp TaxID=1288971 RepID=M1Z6K8_9FIRM|nr:D-alanyl-D-alanine carboxypeptidase family protein [Schnuerera ultunensis]CCQ93198.1 D-alanyl-D-alanine carboxypeptidase dacF [[Clostridium] ultunense Esp]SHD77133.1 D-alanyl-D-alanine carboxypeptidase DacF [[Clostridium] ultunense Esp]
MNRRIISTILLLIIWFTIPSIAFAEDELNIQAKSALLMDYHTGEVIYEKNPHEKLPPASVSKIMTLLLGMEALEMGKINLTDQVRISSHAAGMGGSQLWLEEGETQTVEDLFKSITIRSANDASAALAEHIAGSEEIFVKMMNEKAKSLGMKNTSFMNASGLPDENHYVSAYDVALMSVELLKHKQIHNWLTVYMDEILVGKKKDKVQSLVNTNRLIKEYEGTTGIKTGSTKEAGFCLAASAKRGNLQLIAVIMGSETSKIRFDEAMRLLDYGFANYDSITIGKKGDILGKVEVHKGDIPYIEAVLEKDSYILLPKGNSGNISKEILLPEFLESPINEGQEIGQMIVKLDGVEVDRIKLVSKAKADKAGFKEMFKKTLKNFLINK